MSSYLVNYDLRKPGRNYDSLWNRLREWGATRVLQSTWLIRWDSSAAKIRDDLRTHMDQNDGLLVVAMTGESAWNSLAPDAEQSLRAKAA